MDRLTFIDGCGNAELVCCMKCRNHGNDNENCGHCEKPYEAYEVLAVYEDSGLSPEQVVHCVANLKKLIDNGGIRAVNNILEIVCFPR